MVTRVRIKIKEERQRARVEVVVLFSSPVPFRDNRLLAPILRT